jgi:hypothetical protein
VSGDECYAEIEKLCNELLLREPSQAWATLKPWVDDMRARFGERGANYAMLLVRILRVMPHSTMEVNVDASIKAGRDVVGSVAGLNNKAQIGDVATYNSTVDQSFSNNPKLRDALKQAHEAIVAHDLPKDLKEDVLGQFGKLTAELEQPAPRKSVLQYAWGGLAAVVGFLKPVVELGVLLAKIHGLAVPTST